MSAETIGTIAGLAIGAVLFLIVLVHLRYHNMRAMVNGNDSKKRAEQNAREHRRQLLIDVVSAPNTVQRTPETLELVRSVVVVHKRAYRDDTEVFITTPCGVHQEIYRQGRETGEQVYNRVLTALDYWANKMTDDQMIGSVIKQQKMGDIL